MYKLILILLILFPISVYGKETVSFCTLNEKESTCELENNINKFGVRLLGNSEGIESYNLNDVDGISYVTAVRNQQQTNSCWAFAALGSLESHLKLIEGVTYDFSERHMQYATTREFLDEQMNPDGFNNALSNGGNMYYAISYFNNGNGPILESAMPFENNEDLIDISAIEGKTVEVDVNGVKIITSSDGACTIDSLTVIKDHIMEYGGVEAAINLNILNPLYYSNNSLYYNGLGDTNHAVVLVGWRDDYEQIEFSESNRPINPGAFIAKNSYGELEGENGYIYISYEDIYVCSDTYGYLDVDLNVEDNSYYYDALGYNIGMRYNDSDTAYVGNKFTKKTEYNELLTEVNIGLIVPTEYELYINKIDDNLYSSNIELIQTGSFDYSGYGTIKLDEPIILENDTFIVIVKFTGSGAPIPVQTKRSDTPLYDYQESIVGKSFITSSLDESWVDISTLGGSAYGITFSEPIASIKAYTNTLNGAISSSIYTFENNYIKNIPNSTTYLELLNNLTIDSKYTVSLKNILEIELSDEDMVGTNMTLILDDGADIISYKIIVKGDATGDGMTNIADVAKIYQHLKQTNIMTENSYIKASDVVYDGEIKINDIAKVYQYVKGIILEV